MDGPTPLTKEASPHSQRALAAARGPYFHYGMGVDEDGRYRGYLKATGIRPAFSEHLDNYGIELPADLFAPEAFANR